MDLDDKILSRDHDESTLETVKLKANNNNTEHYFLVLKHDVCEAAFANLSRDTGEKSLKTPPQPNLGRQSREKRSETSTTMHKLTLALGAFLLLAVAAEAKPNGNEVTTLQPSTPI